MENWGSNTCLWLCKYFYPSGGQVDNMKRLCPVIQTLYFKGSILQKKSKRQCVCIHTHI